MYLQQFYLENMFIFAFGGSVFVVVFGEHFDSL